LSIKARAQFINVEKWSWHKGLVILIGCFVILLPWFESNGSVRSGHGVLAYKPYVTHVFFSPSGKVVSITNFSVHTYEIDTKKEEKFSPSDGVNSAVYSADGKLLIIGSKPQQDPDKRNFGVFISDLTSVPRQGHYLTRNTAENGDPNYRWSVQKVILRPKSQEIAVITGKMKHIIEIWDINSNKLMQRFDLDQISVKLTGKPTYALTIAFDPSGQYLVAGGMNGDMFLFDLAKDTVKIFSSGYAGEIYDCAFSPDGQILALAFNQKVDPKLYKGGSLKGYVELWDFSKLELAKRMTWDSDGRCRAITVSPDGRYVLSAGDGNLVRIWGVDSGEQLDALKGHPNKIINSVAISQAGDYVIASGGEHTKIWTFPHAPSR